MVNNKDKQKGDKKRNLFANKHYGAALMYMYLKKQKSYVYADIKKFIILITWSSVLRQKLIDLAIIEYDNPSAEGGKHSFKFHKDEFEYNFTKGFLQFCKDQLSKDIGEGIENTFKRQYITKEDLDSWAKGKGNDTKLVNTHKAMDAGRHISKEQKTAIFSLFWRLQDELFKGVENQKIKDLKKKQQELTHRLDSLNLNYDKNEQEIRKLEGEQGKLLRELYFTAEKKTNKIPYGDALSQIKRLTPKGVMEAFYRDFDKISKVRVLGYISYKLTDLIKEEDIKKGLSLYDVFYKLVLQMGADYKVNQEVLRKFDKDVFTICSWAWDYRVIVGK
ncbi:hypothetical protein C4573_02165 [Candidatus Woesearchaeota archaeon]|nr:MAG: hypothetical protein C4573_02165 [Candidatus Woesearchaeota archaeon]